MRLPLAFLLGIVLSCQPLQAQPQPQSLNWAIVPMPGIFNVEGGQPVSGALYEATQLIDAQMPEVQVRYQVMSLLRMRQSLRKQLQLCSNGLLQTPARDKQGYFIPYLLSTPMHLLVRQPTLNQLLLEDGEVSLDWLFANPYLRGAIATARQYPDDISAQLIKARDSGTLQELTGSLSGENLLLMVSYHRLDYAFDYPMAYSEVASNYTLSDPLISVPLKESKELLPVGVYCPRTPWGLEMAKRIDQAVREATRNSQAFMALHQRWLPAEVYTRFKPQILRFYEGRSATALSFE
ncbi:hypothetical protein [Pseudomonas sp. MS19]|uniref:hypothetical protein n=1 Tax=Pseudomonas sp. MS19 TaxID=2579939 RepID=UPI0015629750|nr:hypothetical protein [Pseudomonas sp. MS19]NRH29434.1 hypothetical protein [Pseudomonas sp. MS19]